MITLVINKEYLGILINQLKYGMYEYISPKSTGDYVSIIYYLQRFTNSSNRITLTFKQVKVINSYKTFLSKTMENLIKEYDNVRTASISYIRKENYWKLDIQHKQETTNDKIKLSFKGNLFRGEN